MSTLRPTVYLPSHVARHLPHPAEGLPALPSPASGGLPAGDPGVDAGSIHPNGMRRRGRFEWIGRPALVFDAGRS